MSLAGATGNPRPHRVHSIVGADRRGVGVNNEAAA
jgi:hypothetical protein